MFRLLDHGRRLTGATTAYWRDFLPKRRSFTKEVLSMTGTAHLEETTRARMIVALKAARGAAC
ncbi:hypothetical protein AOZ06_20560 [Kibdelosporangium phytohabitans]|uniref:Uncharacterized protein n=1 Tax=Kibdelosporangium phytohabitans TaxID=860235 RepID=A0A0N9I3A6_9PSEU|nr:hypothetical protein AOZ06_20560 [Kibdelosporangium phytohabitans]